MDKRLALTILFNGADKLSGTLKKIVGLGKSGAQELAGLKREARDLDKQLQDVRGRLASGSMQGGLVMAERELVKAIAHTNRELEKRQRFLQIDNKVARMQAQGQSLQSAGQSNVIGGTAMLAVPALAVKLAADYDKKLALLAQKTDLNRIQTQAFGREILSAAAAAKQLPDTMLAGADFLASKGMEASQISKLLPAIGRFATAWDADVLDASKAAQANMLSLKVPAMESARALEIMGVAGKRGGFEVRDMAQHFPVLTSALATMGGKGLPAVASLSAALQVLEAKTGDGAMAANDLANMMRFSQTKQGIENFKKFGINIVAEMKRAEKEGRDPLERLAELTQKATGGDNSKIALLFTDTQAGRGALSLVSSIAQYRKIRDEAFAAQGVTAQEFARMSETADANVRSFMGSLTGLGTTLGTHLLPLLTQGANWLARVTNGVAAWADRNPGLAKAIMTVVVAGGALRVGLGAAQFALGGILGPAAQVWGALEKLKAVGGIGGAFAQFAAKFPLAAGLISKGARGIGLAVRFMFGPWGIAIAIIGVAAYLIWTHWDSIKAAFNAGLANLSAAWNWIKSTFMRFPYLFGPIGVAVAFVIRHWDGIKAAFGAGIDFLASLPGRMLAMGKQIMAGLLNGLDPNGLRNRLLDIAKTGINAFKSFFGIKSPSRLFMQMGGHLTEGLARGVDQGAARPVRSVGRMATAVAGAVALSTAPAAAKGPGTASALASAAGGMNVSITIHQQPGEDAAALARRVADELERRASAARRGAYYDEQ